MNPGRNSQIVPVITIVVIVVVSVAAIVALARTLFFNDGTSDTTQDPQKDALVSTTADRAVRMTVRGELTADEKFRSYQITISPTSRAMTTYAGYLDQQIDTVGLDNNTKAYEEFVYALNRAGMMTGTELEGDNNDTRGLCASGKVLEFETLQNMKTVKRLWTSTCSGNKGSLKADSSQLGDMFVGQIPQSSQLLKNLNAK